jgi:hypothetical protein
LFESVKKVVNLTPHVVNIWLGTDKVTVIPPSGGVARIWMQSKPCGDVCGIPVVMQTERKVLGLPSPEDGVVFLVSSVVAKSVNRADVLSPDTTDDGVIRDGNGNIRAVKRLQCFCPDTEVI